MSLENLIKIGKKINFGTLYIKPAFVFQDDDGSIKLQFEADANSALGYLYSALCQMIGIPWNHESPYNELGLYTNCAMHAAGDRAKYGCGPENGNSGGFCPQMTLAYRVKFQSQDHASEYISRCNNYVDYWRSVYPSGIAVGTTKFCPEGGCLALFLNRYDVFYVFKPELGGSWVEFMSGTFAPTTSPAPTHDGGCDNEHNMHLDRCYRRKHARRASSAVVAWDSLGLVGQLSVLLVAFMTLTLSVSIFLARANQRRREGESYLGFFIRDIQGRKHGKRKKLRKRAGIGALDEEFLSDDDSGVEFRTVPSRPGRSSGKVSRGARSVSRSKSRPRTHTGEEDEIDEKSTAKSVKSSRSSRSRSRSKSAKRSSKDSSRRQLV
jgi:hypothetical protein